MSAVIRRLNYQHLLYFWSVVRTGESYSRMRGTALAAPTISAQLRTLEERLGEKLLVKSGRTLVPTEVGRLVYSYANEIFGPRARADRGAEHAAVLATVEAADRHR